MMTSLPLSVLSRFPSFRKQNRGGGWWEMVNDGNQENTYLCQKLEEQGDNTSEDDKCKKKRA